jgi:hypothetical protein
MTSLNSLTDPDQRTGSRNIGGGVVFKVRSTQDSFGAKIWCNNKDWSTWGGSYYKVD